MTVDIDLGPEFRQATQVANLVTPEEMDALKGPVVTLTTKLDHAFEVFKSRQLIKEMFKEFDMKPDEIEALSNRVQAAAKTYNEFQKEHRLLSLAQQMNTMGISVDELRDFQEKEAVKPSRRRGPTRFVMAVVQGIDVYNLGPVPKEIQELGYKTRSEIPMECLTMEWKLAKGLIGG